MEKPNAARRDSFRRGTKTGLANCGIQPGSGLGREKFMGSCVMCQKISPDGWTVKTMQGCPTPAHGLDWDERGSWATVLLKKPRKAEQEITKLDPAIDTTVCFWEILGEKTLPKNGSKWIPNNFWDFLGFDPSWHRPTSRSRGGFPLAGRWCCATTGEGVEIDLTPTLVSGFYMYL